MTDDRYPRIASSPPPDRAGGRFGGARPDAGTPEQRRRARRAIASAGEPSTRFHEPAAGERRRLSDDERRAIQERRRAAAARAAARTAALVKPSTVDQELSTPPDTADGRAGRSGHRERSMPSRGLIGLGALLLGGLVLLAFGGGRLFGTAEGNGPAEVPAETVIAARPPASPPALAMVGNGAVAGAQTAVAGGRAVTPASPLAAGASNRDGVRVVCLDPGHGGSDRGFVRQDNGVVGRMEEAPLALQQAWDLEARLLQQGLRVVMTREADTSVNVGGADVNGDGKTAKDDAEGTNFYRNLDELQSRIDICNEANADLLVSMHVNGIPGKPEVRGYETWYTAVREFGDTNYRFATLAYQALARQIEAAGYFTDGREVNDDARAQVEPQHGGQNLEHMIVTGPEVEGVVDPSRMPGAIVEALFITNDGDAQFLASPLGQAAIVNAYEEAVVQFFQEFPA